jgi:hypothetical protein
LFPAWTNEESKPTEVGAPVLRDPAVVVLTRCAPFCFFRAKTLALGLEAAIRNEYLDVEELY